MTIHEKKLTTIELNQQEKLALKAMLHGETHRKLTTRLNGALADDFETYADLRVSEGCNFLIQLEQTL